MQEVSTRACEVLFVTLALEQIPAERLVQDLPVDLADLREPGRRIDWEVFCDLLERFEALVGGAEQVERAGTRIFDEPIMRRSRALAGLFLSLRHVYEYGGRWRTAAFYTNVLRRFEELPDGRFRVTLWIPESQRGCETFFRMRCGAQRATPRWFGYGEEAHVEAELGSHSGVYWITPPARRRPLAQRVKHALRRKLTRGPAIWDLVVRQEELRASHDRLHAALEEIEGQARALRESDARFRELTAHLPEVFWIQSADFERVLYVSPAYESIFGRDASELEENPRAWLEGVHPDDRVVAAVTLEELVANPGPRQLEFRIVRPDGLLRWVKQRWSPVGEDGRVVRFVGLLEDVTERKRLEESVREAQKLEATGKLAGGVAHDFNNLLTVILADCDFLLERGDDLEARLLVEEIRGAAARGATLADDLLAFGRRQAFSPRVIDWNEALENVARMLRRVLPHEIEIVIRAAGEPCPVEADPEDLDRVILNLATNARDAMPEGGRLELGLSNVRLTGPDAAVIGPVEPGPYVRLAVRDTGAGMDAKTRERIFEPFFTTKPLGSGTGLGLPIVHGIVRQARGAVSVDSGPGRGTTVAVLLPRRPGTVEALEEPASVTSARGGDETILLVEDEEPVRRACARVLRGHGYTVLEARDGRQALELATRESRIQALVTDVVMPGMSGLEVVDRISELRPGIRTLAISGYTGSEEAHQALATRGVPLVPKPFDQATLLGRLREVLDA